MSHAVIAAVTDFGYQDGFSGVMKGVILSLYRDAVLVDIAHGIPAQDVWHGSWVLNRAFDAFPAGTFFLAVVDPQVGSTEQRKLAIYFADPQKGLILPDNGLAMRVLDRIPGAQCVSLENPRYYLSEKQPSQTFHGRDIYAPAAAHLAKAWSEGSLQTLLADLGPRIPMESLKTLPMVLAQELAPGTWKGQIDIIDTYGNLITNIPSAWLPVSDAPLYLEVSGLTYPLCYVSHYGALPPMPAGELAMALIPASHGMLEIMSPCASAKEVLQAIPGMLIRLKQAAP